VTIATRHAVVTGAARGIGAAIARALIGAGARVTLLGRDAQRLASLAATLAGPTCCVAADVSDPDQVTRAFVEARERLGPVALLVNNAGQAETAPFGKMSLDVWHRMLAVNLTGTMLCSQAALADMVDAAYGRVVNIASTAALRGFRYGTAYAASKHGVLGLTRSLALELASSGIAVNAVCPGYTDTDIVRSGVARLVERTGRSESESLATFTQASPLQRLIRPDEVAATVRWLCTEAPAGFTGQAFSLSGGEVMT